MNEESTEVNRGVEVRASIAESVSDDHPELWRMDAGGIDAESEGCGCGGGDSGGSDDGGTSDDTGSTADTQSADNTGMTGSTNSGSAIL